MKASPGIKKAKIKNTYLENTLIRGSCQQFIHFVDVGAAASPSSCDQCDFSRLVTEGKGTEMSINFRIYSLLGPCSSSACPSAVPSPLPWSFAGVCHSNPFGSPPRSREVLHLQHQRHEWIWAQAAFAPPPLQLSPPTRSTSLSSIGLRVEPGAGVEGRCYTYLCCVCACVCVR